MTEGPYAEPQNPTDSPTARIRARALALGFDAVGFAPARLGPEAGVALRAFLEKGCHGDMGWLADRADQRVSPEALWGEAMSAVVVGVNYGPDPDQDPRANLAASACGNISVYARNRDYHDVLKKKLRVLARWMGETFGAGVKLFVDTAPIMEKPLAQQAGIGWQGKHTNLVSRRFGSWLFLGEILTTLTLDPDPPGTDHCGTCSRCLDVCPTRAFTGPYQLDARRCISYLTIEHKGPIPSDLRPLMGNRIYGCDDCLSVCPWNRFAHVTTVPELRPKEAHTPPDLAELATLTEETFRARFAGSPVKRIGRDRFVRNVLVAIGNSREPTLDAVIRPLAEADPSPLVRETAAWALARLRECGNPATDPGI